MTCITAHTTTSGGSGARRSRLVVTLCAALLAALTLPALAGCGSASSAASSASPGGSSSNAPEMANVTLIMDWLPWVLDIPVDVAQQEGYYAAAGLKVKQIVPSGATDVVKFVSTGRAQFGLYYAPDTLTSIGQGAPLLSVGSLMSHAPVGLAIAPGVHVSSPKDLVGKVVGVPLIPSTRASFESLLKAGGVNPAQVKVVDPGYNLVAPLLKGTYQAVAFTQFGELVEAEAAGYKPAFLDFRRWGTPDYAFLNIVTSSAFARAHPNTTRAFTSATMRGLTYAVQHPEEAVNIYVARHPELKKGLLLAQWNAAVPSLATAGAHPAGWQDPQAWSKLNTWLVQTGLLDKPMKVSSAMSNAYLTAK